MLWLLRAVFIPWQIRASIDIKPSVYALLQFLNLQQQFLTQESGIRSKIGCVSGFYTRALYFTYLQSAVFLY
ncbi:MAG: hypothetical protein KME57_25300 [Scytonema hyalinum WJT4-NPBG1]|jgi:hypothetical protein|nr:hypothetical protein [Scytonema hyalinum WJT4-NPBG1]